MARIDRRVALGPGCALQLEGIVTDAPPAWVDAGDLIEQATAVTTRFTDAARTIAVVLAGTNQPLPTDVSIDLDGATRVADKSGKVRPPRVVMAGSRAVLLYDIAPVAGEAVSVRVLPGGPWRLHGVLGGLIASEQLVRTIATQGIEAIAGRLLLAADGKPITVAWEAPALQKPRASRASKKAVSKKSAAKKSPAKSGRRGKRNG